MVKQFAAIFFGGMIVAGFIFIGCSHTTEPVELPHHSSKYMDAPLDQIESFENEMQRAIQTQVNLKAPAEFGKAKTAFEEAQEINRVGDDMEEFREKMHEARIHLDRAIAQGK